MIIVAKNIAGEKFKKIFFVFFILLSAIIFLNLQFFYNEDKNAFSSSLETSVSNVNELIEPIGEISQNLALGQNTYALNAESAIVLSISSGQQQILFESSKDKKLPIASLAKLMTALVVLENYDLERMVVINESAMSEEGVQGVLKLGEELSVKDLLYITLIESSNRAASALAGAIGRNNFVSLMNAKAKDLGLSNTYFYDATGLDSKTYSTAEDLAKLSVYLFENYPLFREIISLKEFDLYLPDGKLHHRLENTNKLLGEYGIIGGKTGWTNEARGSFMAIQINNKAGSYLIYVVLGAEDRVLEIKNLIDLIKNYYNFQHIVS